MERISIRKCCGVCELLNEEECILRPLINSAKELSNDESFENDKYHLVCDKFMLNDELVDYER